MGLETGTVLDTTLERNYMTSDRRASLWFPDETTLSAMYPRCRD